MVEYWLAVVVACVGGGLAEDVLSAGLASARPFAVAAAVAAAVVVETVVAVEKIVGSYLIMSFVAH
jgi:hypothetical protein